MQPHPPKQINSDTREGGTTGKFVGERCSLNQRRRKDDQRASSSVEFDILLQSDNELGG